MPAPAPLIALVIGARWPALSPSDTAYATALEAAGAKVEAVPWNMAGALDCLCRADVTVMQSRAAERGLMDHAQQGIHRRVVARSTRRLDNPEYIARGRIAVTDATNHAIDFMRVHPTSLRRLRARPQECRIPLPAHGPRAYRR